MQPVVDARLTVALGQPGFERLPHGVTHGLQGEVDDRGGAADRRGDGAGAVIVGRHRAAEGHIQMSVHVDAAGHHQQACGVDHRVSRGGKVGADLQDGLAFEEHSRRAAGRQR